MTTNEEHRAAMAALVKDAASALQRVATYWQTNDLPGDFSTPATGFPFQMDLDEQIAEIWGWAEALTETWEPTDATLDRWARQIMTMVLDDIADHRIPLGIRTFSDLHSYVDANDYLQEAQIPWGSDAATEQDENGVRHLNAVTDRVQVMLAATADMLAADLRSKCANEDHDHTTQQDERGRDLDYTIPMVCSHCALPTHYSISQGAYQHDEAGKPCWLNGADNGTPCTPNDVIDLDELVRILKALGIPAFTEMTGGGVATVYAGTVTGHHAEDPNWPLYQVCAGPGWFEGPNYSDPRATLNEFFIGPDGDPDGETTGSDPLPGFLAAVQRVMELCDTSK